MFDISFLRWTSKRLPLCDEHYIGSKIDPHIIPDKYRTFNWVAVNPHATSGSKVFDYPPVGVFCDQRVVSGDVTACLFFGYNQTSYPVVLTYR